MIDFAGFVQTEGQPIYLQIMRYIKQGLAAGTIADGEELPSRQAAMSREWQLKHLTRAEKLALVRRQAPGPDREA